jgi:hypothetical protein
MSDTQSKCDPQWHDGALVAADYMIRGKPSHEQPLGGNFACCAEHVRMALQMMVRTYGEVTVRSEGTT